MDGGASGHVFRVGGCIRVTVLIPSCGVLDATTLRSSLSLSSSPLQPRRLQHVVLPSLHQLNTTHHRSGRTSTSWRRTRSCASTAAGPTENASTSSPARPSGSSLETRRPSPLWTSLGIVSSGGATVRTLSCSFGVCFKSRGSNHTDT